jgi:hypothetical protein
MRGPCYDCVPVSIALALMLAAPFGTAFAQDSNKLAATFNERFPVEETSTPPPLEIPEVKKEIKKKIKKEHSSDPYCARCGQQYGRARELAQFTTAGSILSSVS